MPGGHLTSTWPKASSDTIYGYSQTVPLYPGDTTGVHRERFDANSPTIDWTEGIFTGYRFFDREKLAPLFPFGYGLSYTKFKYRAVTTRSRGSGVDVAFDVTNVGTRTGATVPQVYLGPAPHVPAGVQQATRALAGFDRVVLAPGQTRHEVIHLGPGADRNGHGDRRAFEYWDSAAQRFVTARGTREVWVGDEDASAHLLAAGSSRASNNASLARTGLSTGLPASGLFLLGISLIAVRRRRVV